MHNQTERITELFLGGYNCSQTVLSMFCEQYGLDMATAQKIGCGFGSGARRAELCGAVSGAVLVIGLKHGDDIPLCNSKVEEFMQIFKEKNQSIVCRELLQCDITTPQGKEHALQQNLFATRCLDLVISAVEILTALGY